MSSFLSYVKIINVYLLSWLQKRSQTWQIFLYYGYRSFCATIHWYLLRSYTQWEWKAMFLHSFLVNNAFLICKEKNCSVELSAILLKHRFNFIYSRLFRRASCNGCGMFVIPTEFVMRAKGYVYHQQCFNCIECGQQLRQGDHCAIKDGQLFCGIDFEKEMNMMALSPRSTNLRNTFQIHWIK